MCVCKIVGTVWKCLIIKISLNLNVNLIMVKVRSGKTYWI